MQNLWKNEKTPSGIQYVDLFSELKKKRVAFHTIDAEYTNLNKNNQQSIHFRNCGNEEFQLGFWTKAMDFYNKSLCYAECGSENVALAYAHRSACFFNMQKYKEALVDIQRIEKANLSDKLRKELEERKSQCEHLMAKQPLENLPKLSYEADQNYPSIANILELKNSEEFGRYFVAKCDIPIGKILLEEESFIGIRKDNDKSVCCSECLRLHSNFIPCQCATAVFCSRECISKNTTHKWECGTSFNLFDSEIKFQVQAIFLAIDTFLNIKDLMQFIEKILDESENLPASMHDAKSKYEFFFKLSKSLPDADDIFLVYKIYMDLVKIPKIAALFDTEEKHRFLAHLIAHNFLVILNNAHGSKSYQSVGGMFSMFNHSCAPNLLQFFDGKQYLMTIRPVKKGDQLFISYLGKYRRHFEQRQEIFKSKWNFICSCERCNPIDKAIDQHTVVSDSHFKFILENGYIEDKSSAILNNCVHFINKYGHSPWSHEIQFVIDIYCAHLARNNLNPHSFEL